MSEPRAIGRYVVERELGRGAMGVVYKAHDPEIDRPVAIKLVRIDLLEGARRDDYLARFRREVQAAGRCQHPNIVAIYDFGAHEGSPFFAMEYVEGRPLDETLPRNAGLGPEAASAIVLQLLDALACAHALGVVHRDIKPGNLLLGAGRRIKVMDFGISRISTSHLTQDGSVLGTPRYMSPEQFRGEPVDARSDLFSTGAVLHELMTGRPPFEGRSFEEVMVKLLYEDLVLAPADAMMTEPMRAIVAKALAKAPADRFASAEAMAGAIRQALGQGAGANVARTVVAGPPAAPEPAAVHDPELDDPQLLATIERRLAQYMGPIAHRLVQKALKDADSVETLCVRLASSIDAADERDRFLTDVRARTAQSARGTGSTTGRGSIPGVRIAPEAIEKVQRDLTRHLGPIAGVLVKRAAPLAASEADLRSRLAEHIELPSERSAFLAGS